MFQLEIARCRESIRTREFSLNWLKYELDNAKLNNFSIKHITRGNVNVQAIVEIKMTILNVIIKLIKSIK